MGILGGREGTSTPVQKTAPRASDAQNGSDDSVQRRGLRQSLVRTCQSLLTSHQRKGWSAPHKMSVFPRQASYLSCQRTSNQPWAAVLDFDVYSSFLPSSPASNATANACDLLSMDLGSFSRIALQAISRLLFSQPGMRCLCWSKSATSAASTFSCTSSTSSGVGSSLLFTAHAHTHTALDSVGPKKNYMTDLCDCSCMTWKSHLSDTIQ